MTRTALLALAILVALLGAAAFGLREWGPPPAAEGGKPAAAARAPASTPPPAIAAAPQQAPQSGTSSQPAPSQPAPSQSAPPTANREAAAPAARSSTVPQIPTVVPAPGVAAAPVGRDAGPTASGPAQDGPSFDIVRVGPDGTLVAAGRGSLGGTVALMAGERELGRAAVDANGEWVLALPGSGLPPGAHGLRLRQHLAGQPPLDSTRTVLIQIPDRPAAVAAAKPVDRSANASTVVPVAPSQPLVVSAPAAGPGPVAVLQAPAAAPRAGDLTVATVDYDETGRIAASGTAVAGSAVRMYLDDVFVGETVAAIDGKWRIMASQPATPGPHRLRFDRLDARGMVVGRLELPFVRQAPPTMTASAASTITIVRGDNLWNIARARYGDGFLYAVIYEANRGFIRDPNLIYPGQVFQMPER